ncbi:hypothetical protein [Lacrimispora sp.]|uniref:hypothetical protein n=1 Tax=Lacrimispora sp. TaxID=2719234 RepID=UPI0032E4952B
MSEISKLKNKASVALTSIKGFETIARRHGIEDKRSKLEQELQRNCIDFNTLSTEIEKLRSNIYERAVVTEDSFLVCRCGGIIKVVQNGSWVEVSRGRIEANIIDLLSEAEDYIYEKYNSYSEKKYKFSAIKAFNIVHGILISVSGTEKQRYTYIINEECEKARKPSPHVEITIRPAKEVLKQAKYRDIATNVVTSVGGPYKFVAMGLTIVISSAEIIESEEFLTWDNFDSFEGIVSTLYDDIPLIKNIMGEVIHKSVGNLIAQYSNIATIFNIIQDLLYESYANFVGEIKVTVSTYCEEYQFKGTYNIMGEREGENTLSYRPIQKSNFLLQVPEDNKTTIKYKIYKDGMFQAGEYTDLMY